MHKKNRVQRMALAAAFALFAASQSAFALTTADFADALSTSSVVATTLQLIFFAVLPIALVVGLSIWGFRMAKRLAR